MPGSSLRDLWKLSDRRHPNRPSGRFARACSSRPPVGGRAQIGHVAEFARVSSSSSPEGARAQLGRGPARRRPCPNRPRGRFARVCSSRSLEAERSASPKIGQVADLPGPALRGLRSAAEPKSATWPICPGLLFKLSGRCPSSAGPRPSSSAAVPKSATWPICPGLLFEIFGS